MALILSGGSSGSSTLTGNTDGPLMNANTGALALPSGTTAQRDRKSVV